ncbi:phosphomannomutase/phosphoglucomutase [Treponema sp.]|uniref:phosphomannomutase/phosphoglucomutase n=1 Tax=Treponema sp. TaxID=166 RepID=UPI003EFCC5F4
MAEYNLMKLQNGSDIRGVAAEGVKDEPVNLTEEACNLIGQAFVLWLEEKTGRKPSDITVGIGRDARITGKKLACALAQGIAASGARTVDCGLSTTPAQFMSIVFEQTRFTASVMVTASHLPFNRNGLKFFTADGGLEHGDIEEILKSAQTLKIKAAGNPFNSEFDLLSLYAEHLKKQICLELGAAVDTKPLAGLKIAVDAGNGDAGFFVEKILIPLGADTSGSQFLEPDGMFPNHIPNPENKQAMQSVQRATVESSSDLGLIFDTDVDRMSAVFSSGEEVSRDAIIALFAAILAPDFPGSTIVTDSVTSDRLTFFLEKKLGLRHLRYMRGYKNVIDKCRSLNEAGTVCPLAMETSGHGALRDNYYLDDGAFLAVKLIAALAKASRKKQRIEELIAELPPAGTEAEYRFKIKTENFREYGNKVLAEFQRRADEMHLDLPESYEGVRISFHDEKAEGWLLLRLSLHDPVMPLNIEGKTPADKAAIVSAAKTLVSGFELLDTSVLDS